MSTLLELNYGSCFEALKPPPPPTAALGPLCLFRILAAASKLLHNSKEVFGVVTPLRSNDPVRIGYQRRTSGSAISRLRLVGQKLRSTTL
nr:hypothetical protein Iba_chr15aCG10660 [Ipomoea batatas]